MYNASFVLWMHKRCIYKIKNYFKLKLLIYEIAVYF